MSHDASENSYSSKSRAGPRKFAIFRKPLWLRTYRDARKDGMHLVKPEQKGRKSSQTINKKY
jgi:hypothetical protein